MKNIDDLVKECGRLEDDLFEYWERVLAARSTFGLVRLGNLENQHQELMQRLNKIRQKGIPGRVDGFIDDDDPGAMQKIHELTTNQVYADFRIERVGSVSTLASDVSASLGALRASVGLARSTGLSDSCAYHVRCSDRNHIGSDVNNRALSSK
jgi:hypothetical protein